MIERYEPFEMPKRSGFGSVLVCRPELTDCALELIMRANRALAKWEIFIKLLNVLNLTVKSATASSE